MHTVTAEGFVLFYLVSLQTLTCLLVLKNNVWLHSMIVERPTHWCAVRFEIEVD